MATFEGYERREAKILSVLKEYGINSIDECKTICEEKGIDPYTIVQETQPICFENAKWAYTVGSAIAFKEAERTGDKSAATAAANIGIGLQSGQNAPFRGDRVLRIPRWPRVLRGC